MSALPGALKSRFYGPLLRVTCALREFCNKPAKFGSLGRCPERRRRRHPGWSVGGRCAKRSRPIPRVAAVPLSGTCQPVVEAER